MKIVSLCSNCLNQMKGTCVAELTFWRTTDQVTGSCNLVRARHAAILLECGLIQGRRQEEERNMEPLPFAVGQLEATVLSYAHLDHSGRLLINCCPSSPLSLMHQGHTI